MLLRRQEIEILLELRDHRIAVIQCCFHSQVPGTDIVFEKDTPIYISLYGLQEDPRFFEKSHKFNPERFADGTKISDAYIPIGIGPRMCVGMKVGQLHAKIVIALVLREYELSQRKENKCELDPRSTFTAAAEGILLNFKKLARRSSRIAYAILDQSEPRRIIARAPRRIPARLHPMNGFTIL